MRPFSVIISYPNYTLHTVISVYKGNLNTLGWIRFWNMWYIFMTSVMAETVEKNGMGSIRMGSRLFKEQKKRWNVWGSGLKKQVESKSGSKNAEHYFSRQNRALAFPAMVLICVIEVTRRAEKSRRWSCVTVSAGGAILLCPNNPLQNNVE